MSNYLQSAFDATIKNAKKPEQWCVALIERSRLYGGAEEGGWWYDANHVASYQYFASEEDAMAAKAAVLGLAEELKQDSRRSHGEHCLRTMEWLDARGLDADFLPEPDGPTDYWIYVGNDYPEFNNARGHYE